MPVKEIEVAEGQTLQFPFLNQLRNQEELDYVYPPELRLLQPYLFLFYAEKGGEAKTFFVHCRAHDEFLPFIPEEMGGNPDKVYYGQLFGNFPFASGNQQRSFYQLNLHTPIHASEAKIALIIGNIFEKISTSFLSREVNIKWGNERDGKVYVYNKFRRAIREIKSPN